MESKNTGRLGQKAVTKHLLFFTNLCSLAIKLKWRLLNLNLGTITAPKKSPRYLDLMNSTKFTASTILIPNTWMLFPLRAFHCQVSNSLWAISNFHVNYAFYEIDMKLLLMKKFLPLLYSFINTQQFHSQIRNAVRILFDFEVKEMKTKFFENSCSWVLWKHRMLSFFEVLTFSSLLFQFCVVVC